MYSAYISHRKLSTNIFKSTKKKNAFVPNTTSCTVYRQSRHLVANVCVRDGMLALCMLHNDAQHGGVVFVSTNAVKSAYEH